MFLLQPFIHIFVGEEIGGLMLGCSVPYTGYLFLKYTCCLVCSFPHWQTSNRNQQWYYLCVFIKGMCPGVSLHSQCKAGKCCPGFTCDNSWRRSFLMCDAFYREMLNEGQRMLLSGFSSLHRNVSKSVLDSSCCFLTHFLTLYSPEAAILERHKCGFLSINVNAAVRAAHLIIVWAESGGNGVPWIRNLLPAAFPLLFIWICTVLIQLELSSAASSTSPCLEERWTSVLECFHCVFVEFASQTQALL